MAYMILIVVIGLIVIFSIWLWQNSPGSSVFVATEKTDQFPEVSGYNLDREEFIFPRDFEGEHNLIMVAFQQYHQNIVNTWIPHVQELEAETPGFVYYELPTIKEMSLITRTFINEGMRAGIPDQTARERTVTLYIDKDKFTAALNIPDEDDIYLFLVEEDGSIIWREKGAYDGEKAGALQEILQEKLNLK